MHDVGEERAQVRVVMVPIRLVFLEGMGTVVTGRTLETPVRGETASTSSIVH